MLGKYKNIIIVVVIVIIGFIVYSIIKPDPESEALLQTAGPSEVSILGEDIIQALHQIDSLNLDASILNDPVVNSLTDHGRPIKEESYGKDNPFGPLGDDVGVDNDDMGDEEEPEEEGDVEDTGGFTL